MKPLVHCLNSTRSKFREIITVAGKLQFTPELSIPDLLPHDDGLKLAIYVIRMGIDDLTMPEIGLFFFERAELSFPVMLRKIAER